MQKEWDYIDDLIKNSMDEVKISQSYDEILMQKVMSISHDGLKGNERSILCSIFDKKRTAISLILSGILILIVSTTSLQYKVMDVNRKLRNEALMIQYEYNYKFDFNKNIFGAW
ncbi:MAG: hypothetical protein Q8936_16580 [Bacillota bacterium]|nr:hypothetical protein [Bacillota bacterium]